jgi:hypothetical protein
MTESLSNQFDGMLPGVDWSGYKPPTAPPGYSIDPTVQPDRDRVEKYQEEFPNIRHFYRPPMEGSGKSRKALRLASANVPLEGLHADRTFYTPEKQAEVSTAREKVDKIVQKRTPAGMTVPEGLRFKYFSEPTGTVAARSHNLTLHDPELGKEGYETEVGQVKWSGNTGKVEWLGVDEGYRHALPHLLSRAHQIADEYGDTGPTHATNLTDFSYSMMKKHNPSFIDRENTTVNYDELPPEPHR